MLRLAFAAAVLVAAAAPLPVAAATGAAPQYDMTVPSVVRICIQPYFPFVVERVRAPALSHACAHVRRGACCSPVSRTR